jgi:signal transduction histidine kinase
MGPGALLSEPDELWIRLVWLTRLRWSVPLALYGLAVVFERLVGLRFADLPLALVAVTVLVVNALYALLLRRWQPVSTGSDHARRLRLLAHAQVLLDLSLIAAALVFTGGAASPFWPLLAPTVLAAALFFPRRPRTTAAYGAVAVAMLAMIVLYARAPTANVAVLAALIALESVIATFYARRLELEQDAALELERVRTESTDADEVSRRKDEILSLLSHELRNPLSAMRGFVSLAKKLRPRSGGASQPLDQTLARMDAQVERMTRLVSDLYDLAAVRAGQLKLERRTCDLVALGRELAARFVTIHPGLTVEVEGPEALWGAWDAQRIDQMLTNLVGNAVKYAGATSRVRISIVRASGSSVHLEVIDHGPGIAPEKLPILFEPFRRVDAQGRKAGLGLGLSIAKEIAVLHGGAIWVESTVGSGTTFHVRLPTNLSRAPS